MALQLDSLSRDVQTWSINLYIDVATTVWLYHEYLLTLPKERQCIWRRQTSAVSVVFYVTRYVTLFKQALKVAQFVSWAPSTRSGMIACELVMRTDALVTAILYLNVSGKCYRNFRLAAAVFLLGLVHACSNAYTNNAGAFHSLRPPLTGCLQFVIPDENLSSVLGENQPLTAAYRIAAYTGTGCIILSELIVQVYTWRRTLDIQRTLRSFNVNAPLFTLLLRDGAISYIAVSVFLCRFILSLRQVRLSDAQDPLAKTQNSIVSRVVGNAGAPLDIELSRGLPVDPVDSDEEEEVIWITDDPLMAGLMPLESAKEKELDDSDYDV
ncbi:hypothetical protein NM688_g4900 [Phlebia brevispora]|uniref:Uncharacterized protein n=1 Tax=Phlebia brevispora TaxID=194682 RepID=A0ACC1T1T4_9APHY|nr:hypothetical protein NM688_g4900 [Phlebia brevispora]